MKQPAYLFTAGVTVSQMRAAPGPRGGTHLATWDTCMSLIVYGGEAGQAQKTFEHWCQGTQDGENPAQTEIKKLVGAEFVEQMLTESGGQPLDWPEIGQRILDSAAQDETASSEASATGDSGEGFWVDVQQAVPAGSARLDVDSLKRGLPEDIPSALNWSPDKKFFFLLTCLSVPPVVTELIEEIEEPIPEEDFDSGERIQDLDETVALLPEMREKEAAALIEARNSVVAAWLWRKFAAETRLAKNEILVSPCCGIVPATPA